MKIALVVPDGEKEMNAMGSVARPPLGVCYLKSFLANEGYPNSKVFHQVKESDSDLVQRVCDFSPDIVGFSTMSFNFPSGTKLAQDIKSRNPGIVTVFGGEHITGCHADQAHYGSDLMTRLFQDNPSVDFAIPFEGERALTGLVRGLEMGADKKTIPGVIYRDTNQLVLPTLSLPILGSTSTNNRNGIVITEPVERILNLDDIPIADRSDLPYSKYHSPDDDANLEYMHTSRGCDFKCSFCATPISSPGGVRINSAERIVNEMQKIYEEYGRDSFFFCDELFTCDSQRVTDVCETLIDRGLGDKLKWRTFARVDDITRGKIDLELMSRAGLNGIFYGIESMNQRTLKLVKKGTRPDQIHAAVEAAYQNGVNAWGTLIVGYPWETEEELVKSLDDYLELGSNGRIKKTYAGFLAPFPGTRLYQQCMENDWISDPNFLQSDCSKPVLKTPIPEERLIQIYNEFLEKVS